MRRLRLACPYGQEALSHQARPSGEAPYDADSIESSDDICQDQLAYIQLTHIDIGKKGSQIVELQKTIHVQPRFGVVAIPFFHGPGLNNWNLALHKGTTIREDMTL